MAKQKITYEQVLEKLSLPADTDKVRVCKFCGELLHLVVVNRFTAFWVHRGSSVTKCCEANTFAPGHPMIVQNLNFYRQMTEIWNEMMMKPEKLNKKGEKNEIKSYS